MSDNTSCYCLILETELNLPSIYSALRFRKWTPSRLSWLPRHQTAIRFALESVSSCKKLGRYRNWSALWKVLNMNHLQFTAPISLLKMSPSLCLGVTVFSSPQNKDVKVEDHAGRELNTLKSAQTIPQSVFWVINKTEPQTGRLEWPLKKPTMEILCRNCFNIWGYIYWVNVEDADTSAGRTVSAY